MDNYLLIDEFVKFVKDKVEEDIEDLLEEYKLEFNELYNRDNELCDYDLSHTYYELLSELYSIGEG